MTTLYTLCDKGLRTLVRDHYLWNPRLALKVEIHSGKFPWTGMIQNKFLCYLNERKVQVKENFKKTKEFVPYRFCQQKNCPEWIPTLTRQRVGQRSLKIGAKPRSLDNITF